VTESMILFSQALIMIESDSHSSILFLKTWKNREASNVFRSLKVEDSFFGLSLISRDLPVLAKSCEVPGTMSWIEILQQSSIRREVRTDRQNF